MSSDGEEAPQGGGMPGMEGMGGMGGMGDDDDMSEDDNYTDPAALPEGCTKEILTPAPSENFKKPKAGDDVTVHYVGTLLSDGSEFDSSRGRGDPFVFGLGRGQVIKGWDVGVATMKKGEIAKFTFAPEFAYGEAGSPPKIPASATLVFEVELLSWASKDDLFGDEGVIKTQLKEGTGWKSPKDDDEVFISMDGKDMEYVVGSGKLGATGKACDKALLGMKRGEEASLKCGTDYGDATVSLTLKEIFESKDVSFLKDKTMSKKQVVEGEGYDMPKDAAKVTLSVESATDIIGRPLPGFQAKVLEFTAGNGEVCDALECAAQEMKKGEKAVLTIANPKAAVEAKLGLKDVAADKVVFKLELQDFEKAPDTWNLSEEDKIAHGESRKAVATELFKSGRYAMALGRYKRVGDLFNYIDNFKEENKTKAKDLKKVCELNKAACYLKLDEWADAKKACAEVLKNDGQNVKALFRKAQADCSLKNYADCIFDCKRVVDLDPQNKDVRVLLKKAQAGQKEDDKKSQGLFANMCKALGKGPIPEPYKAKKEPNDDMDEDDDYDDDEPPIMGADAEAADKEHLEVGKEAQAELDKAKQEASAE